MGKAKVNAAIELLKDAYRCNYRCGFNLGCKFSRNSYSRSCVRFPTPEKTSYKLAGLGALKVDWNGCAYNCLRTCTVAEKTPVFEETKHRDAIKASRTKYLSDLAAKVAAWEVEIAQWKAAAEKTLNEKALCLVPKSYCGVAPTQDQIDAFHAVLKQQAQQWIKQVEQRLLAQVTALNTRITNGITSWFTRANAFVTSVKAQFDACVAKKDSKIASQKSCLKARIITQRTNLEAMLKKFADAHKLQFDKFYTCSFGENPTNANILSLKAYKTDCVDAKVAAVVTKFNKFWAIW